MSAKTLVVTEQLIYKFEVPADFDENPENMEEYFTNMNLPHAEAFEFAVVDRDCWLEEPGCVDEVIIPVPATAETAFNPEVRRVS